METIFSLVRHCSTFSFNAWMILFPIFIIFIDSIVAENSSFDPIVSINEQRSLSSTRTKVKIFFSIASLSFILTRREISRSSSNARRDRNIDRIWKTDPSSILQSSLDDLLHTRRISSNRTSSGCSSKTPIDVESLFFSIDELDLRSSSRHHFSSIGISSSPCLCNRR